MASCSWCFAAPQAFAMCLRSGSLLRLRARALLSAGTPFTAHFVCAFQYCSVEVGDLSHELRQLEFILRNLAADTLSPEQAPIAPSTAHPRKPTVPI